MDKKIERLITAGMIAALVAAFFLSSGVWIGYKVTGKACVLFPVP